MLILPYVTATLISAGLMTYAVTAAFVWDEGFHLLAAQLIQSGKRPYLDFCFPQTPLNAYWNAFWMSRFGDSWRVTHVVAALLMAGTMFTLANWILTVFQDPRWRSWCATAAVVLLGTNLTVLQFGPIAQAYALCMFCTFAAFRLLVRVNTATAFIAGLLAGIAAGSSLLSAPVAVVLAVWLLLRRRLYALVFICGCVAPFAPVIWLYVQGPQQTFFNVVQYQALFRRVNWGNATEHDADVLTSWVNAGSGLLFTLLLVAGALLALRRRLPPAFTACFWISAALVFYISIAHPTFARYYIVGAAFYVALSAAGFCWTAEKLWPTVNPVWPTLALAVILLLSAGRFVYNQRDATTWAQYEKISAKIASVTPPNGSVFADEQVYFLLHWTPPSGMEFSYAHKLNTLSPAEEAKLHILSLKDLEKETKARRFAVFESCDDDYSDNWHLDKVFKHREDFDDCYVLW